MGKRKYQLEELFAKSTVVSYKSIERFVKSQEKVKQYPKQLVRNLMKQKKIFPLMKGYYTSFPEVSLAVFCFQPAYLGLQDALSYHGLWEQETIPIILTSRKVRSGLRVIMGSNVFIRHLDQKYMFGWEYSHSKFTLPYSDLEKTLIDMVHYKQRITPEVAQEFRQRLDEKKIKKYLYSYPAATKAKVLKVVRKKG